jgi:hypothetical protein
MKDLYCFLESISSNFEGITENCYGIPMSKYFRNENWIQVKDSCIGAKYSSYCKENCQYYRNGNCQEGVFNLFLSSNLTLHLSGCKNTAIYFDLNKCEELQIKKVFIELLNLM